MLVELLEPYFYEPFFPEFQESRTIESLEEKPRWSKTFLAKVLAPDAPFLA